jgi:hypothetical protein
MCMWSSGLDFRASVGQAAVDQRGRYQIFFSLRLMMGSAYSLAQSSSGMLNDESQAAGRVFCFLNASSSTEYVVWTENAGRLLAWASGGPHEDVLYWWSNLHHTIYFGSTPMNM